jgi:two-component system alkaline phosphatase synthesis response regulator PhoP
MAKVLIVEDDDSMSVALRDGFEYEKYAVSLAKDGESALRMATRVSPDLIILDVMLPKMSGLDVCKRLRSERNGVPIIMLTARGQEIDKVLGLKIGADDYVTKPFSFMELMARVEAVMRRAHGQIEPIEELHFGDVSVFFKRGEATKGGAPIDLSPREFTLLRFLAERKGDVVSREQLLTIVWGYDSSSTSRTVDVHIAKLRRKIETSPEEPKFIITVHGMGYKFMG